MLTCFNRHLDRFSRSESGVVAMIFGLTLFALMMMIALAVDIGRAVNTSSRMTVALDAAALAAAKGLRLEGLSEAQARDRAETMFRENFSTNLGTDVSVNSVDVTIDSANSAVTVAAETTINNTIAQIAGFDTMTFNRSARAIFEAQDVEVALQLDVTGSMGWGTKIADLRAAAKDLLKIIIPDVPTGQRIRVGLAPFSSGVNAGAFADAITEGRATTAGSTCVFERMDVGVQNTDVAPLGLDSLRSVDDLPSGASRTICPSVRIQPLTEDLGALEDVVDDLTAAGYTAGHLGSAWAQYLLSPNWSSIWPQSARPAAYGNGTIKAALLMTDGEYNTFGGKNNANTSFGAAIDTCAAMKANGVVIYTVGFMLTEQKAKDVMNACASNNATAYLAEDGDELRAAFRNIAQSIIRLRLTN